MTAFPLANLTQVRERLTPQIQQTAVSAIVDPSREHLSRMAILGHLLHPAAAVVDAAITRFESGARFPTVDRERIADYITRAIERSVLGLSKMPMDLRELADASSPFAWSDRFAQACVQSGITEVRRAHTREVSANLQSLDESFQLGSIASLDWSARALSAEEVFMDQERHGLICTLTDVVESWSKRGGHTADRLIERARVARTLLGIPAAVVADNTHKRWLGEFLTTETALDDLRMSLVAHRDLASGEPQWEQLSVDDRLLDLWMDYTADQAATLLSAPVEAVKVLAQEATTFLARPRESRRVQVRRQVKALSNARGWSSLAMRLEKAWSAEFFEARCDINGYDTRTDEEAEAERSADAADWQPSAERVLAFSKAPFGPDVRTVQDVADWLSRAYQLALSAQAEREAA